MFPSFIANGCLRVANVILEICLAKQTFIQITSLGRGRHGLYLLAQWAEQKEGRKPILNRSP